MTGKPIIADRHRQTRNAHALETAEDYVEAVLVTIEKSGKCRIVDLAQRFGVSHVTVNKIIKRLQSEGLVKTEPYGPVELTSEGKRMALRSKKRHETVFRFLLAIGVDESTAAIDSEGIEHHVSPQTLKVFEKFIKRNLGTG